MKYQRYYNGCRPHQGINGKIPNKNTKNPMEKVDFFHKSHLNGIITSLETLSPQTV